MKSTVKAPADLVSGEGPLPESEMIFFGCPHTMEGTRERCVVTFVRAPSAWPNPLSKAPSLNFNTLGISFQQMDLGGGINTEPIAIS